MLEFETAQDRMLRKKKVNILLPGPYGIGKTFAARDLDPQTTLFMDCEAGTMALEETKDRPAWQGTTMNMRKMAQKLNVHPWEMCRALACVLAGPEPGASSTSPYNLFNYNTYVQVMCGGNPALFDKFDIIFVDSASVASRWAFDWACQQPESFSEKTKKLDKRSAYGLLGTEFTTWATMLQHQPKKIIMSCLLEEETDEFKRKSWKLQLEGGQSKEKLPGIFDVVMTLNWVDFGEQGVHRAFVTREGNPHGYPAKDRSGLLDLYEKPNLQDVVNKIQSHFDKQQQAA